MFLKFTRKWKLFCCHIFVNTCIDRHTNIHTHTHNLPVWKNKQTFDCWPILRNNMSIVLCIYDFPRHIHMIMQLNINLLCFLVVLLKLSWVVSLLDHHGWFWGDFRSCRRLWAFPKASLVCFVLSKSHSAFSVIQPCLQPRRHKPPLQHWLDPSGGSQSDEGRAAQPDSAQAPGWLVQSLSDVCARGLGSVCYPGIRPKQNHHLHWWMGA